MAASNLPRADRFLVKHCRAGDPAAWELLHARLQKCAPNLLPKALGQDAVNKSLMDELTVDILATALLEQAWVLAPFRESHEKNSSSVVPAYSRAGKQGRSTSDDCSGYSGSLGGEKARLR